MPAVSLPTALFLVGGVNVVNVSIFRIPTKNRANDLFYYDVRHDGVSMDLVSMEEKVHVHYYGTIVTDAPLLFGEESYLLTKEDIQEIYKFS